jgi:hypothetical protein
MTTGYEVIDPRPKSIEAPYTYFLPLQAEIDAVSDGDWVKAVVSANPPSKLYNAERLWMRVTTDEGAFLETVLESAPLDMPLLPAGSVIRLPRTHVVDIIFADPEKRTMFAALPHPREYWQRCLVDQGVLDGTLTLEYLYREAPLAMQDGHAYPDSGWRIRGDTRGTLAETLGHRETAFVALGAVLNRDDSWLHLIDAPECARFELDYATGAFVPVKPESAE